MRDQARPAVQDALRAECRLVLRTAEETELKRAGVQVPIEIAPGYPLRSRTSNFPTTLHGSCCLDAIGRPWSKRVTPCPASFSCARPWPVAASRSRCIRDGARAAIGCGLDGTPSRHPRQAERGQVGRLQSPTRSAAERARTVSIATALRCKLLFLQPFPARFSAVPIDLNARFSCN